MDRKKALEEYVKMVEEGRPFSEDFIGKTRDVENDALRARNLSGDALASQVLKNTGVPIPGKEAPRLKQEDFLNRMVKEQYPEIEPDVRLEPSGYAGGYEKGKIDINSDMAKIWEPERKVGTLFHEAGHQYDDQVLGKTGKNLDMATLRKLQAKGVNLKDMDPTTVYELYAMQHHANIPDIRGGNTFELGALKNYLKKGSFRAVAPLLTGGAGLLASGASEAADTEEMGGASEQAALLREIDEANRRKKNLESSPEIQAASKKLYEEADTGKMFDPRRDALQNILRNRR
jgi:hypothetical protein